MCVCVLVTVSVCMYWCVCSAMMRCDGGGGAALVVVVVVPMLSGGVFTQPV